MQLRTGPSSAYQETNAATSVMDATPHQLTSLLLKAALDNLSVATGAIERDNVLLRTEAIRKAMAIIAELQSTLDKERGGDLAEQLDALYEFSTLKLIEANLEKDVHKLKAVKEVLGDIYQGWQRIQL